MASLSFTNAQNAIPNPGFETWNVNPNYDDVADWGTINPLTYFLGSRTVTKATAPADVHGGSAAIKLESLNIPFQGNAPGIAATGTINTGGYVDGGVSYNKRPISLTGWYKYTVTGTDTGSIEATLSKWNTTTHVRDEVGHTQFKQNATVGSYTQFTVNFTYSSQSVPDTLVVILLTSTRTTGFPLGSKLWVDDLDLVLCSGYTATPSSTNATCTAANGNASVVTANGTLTSTYHWSNSATTNSVTVAAGTYTVTATDFNGCTATASAIVGSTNTNINASATSTNAICTSSSGTATATASTGTGTLSYHWSNNGNTAIINVTAGTYQVTVTDANGCIGTASATVSSTTVPINVTATATTTSCISNTGIAIASTTDGTQPYNYAWSGIGTNNDTIANLGAGGYQVTITDANGCSGTGSASVTTPNGPSATQSSSTISCYGDSTATVNVTTTGGTGTIIYLWSNGANVEDLANMPAGTYTLTITDANNCSFLITAAITEPSQIFAGLLISDVLCHGDSTGTFNFSASGGTAPLSFLWSTGDTTEDLHGAPAGSYSLSITDGNSCTRSFSNMAIAEPPALTVQSTITDASSASATDGSITLTSTGGTSPYNVTWNSGNGTALAAGVYCYTVTDNNGCIVTGCDTVSAPTGIENIPASTISLYPNPANNQLIVETSSTNGKFNFSIFNVEGKLMEQQVFTGTKLSVDVKQLAAGFYSYQLKNLISGDTKTGKLQIQR